VPGAGLEPARTLPGPRDFKSANYFPHQSLTCRKALYQWELPAGMASCCTVQRDSSVTVLVTVELHDYWRSVTLFNADNQTPESVLTGCTHKRTTNKPAKKALHDISSMSNTDVLSFETRRTLYSCLTALDSWSDFQTGNLFHTTPSEGETNVITRDFRRLIRRTIFHWTVSTLLLFFGILNPVYRCNS